MRLFGMTLTLLCLLGCGPVAAGEHPLKGVALVIGETTYVRLPVLANPDKDARDIDHMLDDLGFEVTRALDLRTQQLREKVEAFLGDAEGADVALIYYAGHGIEAGGVNYVMGTDADISDAVSASATLVAIDDVLAKLQANVPVTIVLLDACRSNPFTGQQMLELAGADVPLPIANTGLEVVRGPDPVATAGATSLGVVVGFSASPGQSALDGPAGSNSPYAAALLEHLGAGGYSFGDIMTLVAQEVYVNTGARQLPWTSSSLSKILYFGREQAAASEEDALIIGDRRKLLMSIASVPVESKAYVEGVAAQENLRLTDLYSMLEIIGSGTDEENRESLLDVAQRVRDVLDNPILSGTPTDPELARLDNLANKAIAAGAFRLAFKYRQLEAKRAAKIEKGLDAQQADIDTQRRELAGVYARVAEAAMYTLNTDAETDAYKRAAAQSDLFDKSISVQLRLRAANALAERAARTRDEHTGLVAIALYQDVLKEIDITAKPELWADVQLRMGNAMFDTSMRGADQDLKVASVDAAHAALTVLTQDSEFRRWSEAQRLLVMGLSGTARPVEATEVASALVVAGRPLEYPLDWAFDQRTLGDLLFDLAMRLEADTQFLTRAVVAFDASATIGGRFEPSLRAMSLAQKFHAQAVLALRSDDHYALRAAVADEREALALTTDTHDRQWGDQARLLGQDLAAAAVRLDDQALAEESLPLLTKAQTLTTTKTDLGGWVQLREAEGDARAYLGSKVPLDAQQLHAAIAAYDDASEGIADAGFWDFDRPRIKRIKLQMLLGQTVKASDRAMVNLPEPVTLDIENAMVNVQAADIRLGFEGFLTTVMSAVLDGKAMFPQGFLMADFASADRAPNNLELLRITFRSPGLGSEQSRDANYSRCGPLVADPGGTEVNLHYGRESFLNSCVFSMMAPEDAAYWRAVWAAVPVLVHKAAEAGDETAIRVDELFKIKPALL